MFALAGLGWGCATDPEELAAPWTSDETSATVPLRVLPPSEALYYPQPGDDAALADLLAYGLGTQTKLPPDYIYLRLQQLIQPASSDQATQTVPHPNTPQAAQVAEAFDRLTVGSTDAWADLLAALELEFVHRPDTSSLDLLGLELSARFRSFAWEHEDYPGGIEGPHEMYAGTLADALDGVTPERRANRTDVSVITRSEATDALWDYILGQWRPVPGEDNKQLNRHAVPAYVAMREAAADDGVDLTILSGHRDPKRAAANAARVGNSFAVASFSSHSLGLAIDVELPRPVGEAAAEAKAHAEADADNGADADAHTHAHSGDEAADASRGSERFRLTTRPMADVVDMRRSPVHKWLHLHAHRFGWYPFQHEPWHWEYNPAGFRPIFFADYPDGPPRDQSRD